MGYVNDRLYITNIEADILSFKLISPGLSGDPDSISFQSIEDDRYITVSKKDGVLELKENGQISGGWQNGRWKEGEVYFKQAASFQKRQDKFFQVRHLFLNGQIIFRK